MNFFAPSNLPKGRRIAVLVGLALVGIGLAGARGLARPGEPTTTQRRIAQLVSALMERKHLSQMRLDDEISRRALKMFFESLDPMKLYFYQSDVDRFAGEQDKIDDYVRQGDVSLAKRIFDVYLDRVGDRTAVAQELVDARHDFTIDESMDRDPKKIGWIASTEEANERWRKRVKYDLLLETSNDVAEEEAREKLHKRYRSINQRAQQTDDDELLEMFLSAVTMSFDPHSSYMSPRSLSDFIIQMRLELHGIGASLENRFGETVVRHIVPGGPADKDGRLKVEDVIVGVGQGVDGEIVDITDVKLTEVVQQIRGKPDTIVRLDVKTAGGTERKIYDITRARVELKDEEARSQILERGPHGEDMSPQAAAGVASDAQVAGDPNPDFEPPTAEILEKGRGDGTVIRIGVISLPSFYMDMDGRREGRSDYKSTTRDVERLLLEFKRKDVDLVVVDLRFNGGGSLPEAVDTTGLFIDQGPVVQVKGPTGQTLPYLDQTPGAVWTGPLVVLTNRFSASASEIFAGAIQDYGRGIVIGDRSTHGKGTVQQLDELGKVIMPAQPPNYGALKFTIQQFYRPGGDSTQNRGVVSDIELPSRFSHMEGIGEADLDYALKFDRVLPLPHDNYRSAGAQVLEELRRRSADRVAQSDYFIAEKKRIDRYLERIKNPQLTLNREQFLAERAELNIEKENEDLFEKLQTKDRPVFARTPYNDEVVAIALDYLQLLGDSRLAQR